MHHKPFHTGGKTLQPNTQFTDTKYKDHGYLQQYLGESSQPHFTSDFFILRLSPLAMVTEMKNPTGQTFSLCCAGTTCSTPETPDLTM